MNILSPEEYKKRKELYNQADNSDTSVTESSKETIDQLKEQFSETQESVMPNFQSEGLW